MLARLSTYTQTMEPHGETQPHRKRKQIVVKMFTENYTAKQFLFFPELELGF